VLSTEMGTLVAHAFVSAPAPIILVPLLHTCIFTLAQNSSSFLTSNQASHRGGWGSRSKKKGGRGGGGERKEIYISHRHTQLPQSLQIPHPPIHQHRLRAELAHAHRHNAAHDRTLLARRLRQHHDRVRRRKQVRVRRAVGDVGQRLRDGLVEDG
jgi:hypothetical protein